MSNSQIFIVILALFASWCCGAIMGYKAGRERTVRDEGTG